MITILWPCERSKVWISSTWQDHLNRPGYNRDYAGTDLAGIEQPLRPSQYNGKVLQSMWSTAGYGYTTFIEHSGILRIRNAHQKTLGVKVGDIVNPSQSLGIMDSTGNSTGTHTHWEVWLKYSTGWRNVDPLDPSHGIQIVNDPAMLVALPGEEIPPMDPVFTPPALPDLVMVKPTYKITTWINLRQRPSLNATKIGEIKPGQEWVYWGYKVDTLGNYWYALRKGDVVGWAAGYYNGELWLEQVEL